MGSDADVPPLNRSGLWQVFKPKTGWRLLSTVMPTATDAADVMIHWLYGAIWLPAVKLGCFFSVMTRVPSVHQSILSPLRSLFINMASYDLTERSPLLAWLHLSCCHGALRSLKSFCLDWNLVTSHRHIPMESVLWERQGSGGGGGGGEEYEPDRRERKGSWDTLEQNQYGNKMLWTLGPCQHVTDCVQNATFSKKWERAITPGASKNILMTLHRHVKGIDRLCEAHRTAHVRNAAEDNELLFRDFHSVAATTGFTHNHLWPFHSIERPSWKRRSMMATWSVWHTSHLLITASAHLHLSYLYI